MVKILVVTLIVFVIEKTFSPRLQWTREENLTLWYGKKHRKYIILF